MSLEINDIYFALRNVQDYDLLVINHSKEVDDIFVLILPKNFSFLIEMDDALQLTWMVNSDHNEGMIIGDWNTKDLLHGRVERYFGHISE